MLLKIEQVFTKEEVAQIREQLLAAEWVDGKATAGFQGYDAKQNMQLAEGCDLAKKISAIMLPRLWNNPLFYAYALPLKVYPPLFNRYQDNGYFDFHIDGALRQNYITNEQIRTDVSSTIFLSEPDSYEGGELIIYDAFGEQSIKLGAGCAIVYPSTTLHRVMPVTKGVRLASFLWLQSMVRDDGKRTLLFELDQAIQALSQNQAANAPEMLRLTYVYHNLIRRWSET